MAALTFRIALTGPPASDSEDFLSDSLGVIFPGDVTIQHGDAGHGLLYTSPHLPKPLPIKLSEPQRDEDRKLFSHYLWNSSLLLAELIEAGTLKLPPQGTEEFDVSGLSTVELGAGTALPSIMSALLGARRVVATDYPAPAIMEVLRENVRECTKPSYSPLGEGGGGIHVVGHEWGVFPADIAEERNAFDRVFVCDCLWMRWQHENLRKSVDYFLKRGTEARAWVIAGFHTGRESMRGFFEKEELAADGLEIERIWERDCNGNDREWVWDRGIEDITIRKSWLVVAILKRISPVSGQEGGETTDDR
ncbi:putative nicotinamide n-methyltransferase [Diplogelasinospora grovesii]|uniref:Nicotinamide n-methyltransferase n=1 Tax=Diplogelasinospora grovesii TaxID=303347 RepID=A0AAN6S540_9PEZI|nr:putative nicotinamide n-methyltransferase [Diplogelasinospora grovesii]